MSYTKQLEEVTGGRAPAPLQLAAPAWAALPRLRHSTLDHTLWSCIRQALALAHLVAPAWPAPLGAQTHVPSPVLSRSFRDARAPAGLRTARGAGCCAQEDKGEALTSTGGLAQLHGSGAAASAFELMTCEALTHRRVLSHCRAGW